MLVKLTTLGSRTLVMDQVTNPNTTTAQFTCWEEDAMKIARCYYYQKYWDKVYKYKTDFLPLKNKDFSIFGAIYILRVQTKVHCVKVIKYIYSFLPLIICENISNVIKLLLLRDNENRIKGGNRRAAACCTKFKCLGGNSQNFLRKFVRFFFILKCFYRVVVHRK